MTEFQKLMHDRYRFSKESHTALIALTLSLVAQNRQALIPILLPSLERNTRHHWNQAVLNLTLNVRKMLSEMDDELFRECEDKFKEDEERRTESEEKQRLAWDRLESAAAYQPVTSKTAVLVGLS